MEDMESELSNAVAELELNESCAESDAVEHVEVCCEITSSMSDLSSTGRARRKERKKKKFVEKRYRGKPLTPAKIQEVVERNQKEIREFLSEAINMECFKTTNMDMRTNRILEDCVKIQITILDLEEGCTKITLAAISMMQLADEQAPAHTLVGFLYRPQKPEIIGGLCELHEILPDFLSSPQNVPLPTSSLAVLEKFGIIPHNGESRRYANFSLYCRYCDQHVRNMVGVLEHIRVREHVEELAEYLNSRVRNGKAYLVDMMRQEIMNQRAHISHFVQFTRTAVVNHIVDVMSRTLNDKLKPLCSNIQIDVFGSMANNLYRDPKSATIDVYVKMDSHQGVATIQQRMSEVLHSEPSNDFFYPGALFTMVLGENEKLNVFYTLDSRASDAVLLTKFLRIFIRHDNTFYIIACHFRYWAEVMGLPSTNDDRGIPGVVFDLMALFFLQRQHLIPILDEQELGMPLVDFLNLSIPEQDERLVGRFMVWPGPPDIAKIFFDMFVFFGAHFSLDEVVQVTSRMPILKEKNDLKCIRVIDPITGSSISHFRSEMSAYLQALIFYTTVHLLRVEVNSRGLRKMTMVTYTNRRGQSIPYVLFATSDSRPYTIIAQIFDKHRHGGWIRHHKLRPPLMTCDFCRLAHNERNCPKLKVDKVQMPALASVLRKLDVLIEKQFAETSVNKEVLQRAQDFVDDLEVKLRADLEESDIRLELFGSLVSGFGSHVSDLDMCLRLNDDVLSIVSKGEEILRKTFSFLQRNQYTVRHVAGAKVPIVKFEQGQDGFTGDISYYNCLALYNTRMLREYCDFDPRVAPLGIALKTWARAFDLNDASVGTMSSYAVIILMIFYLQKVSPPVLPRLQDENDFPELAEREALKIGGWDVKFMSLDESARNEYRQKIERLYGSLNTSTVGELFAGFFDFFLNEFNFQQEVVQIRTAEPLSKIAKEWTRSIIAVEDPFDLAHNLTSGVKKVTGLYIFKSMNIMQLVLREGDSIGEDFTLDSFEKFVPDTQGAIGKVCYHCKQRGHNMAKCPVLLDRKRAWKLKNENKNETTKTKDAGGNMEENDRPAKDSKKHLNKKVDVKVIHTSSTTPQKIVQVIRNFNQEKKPTPVSSPKDFVLDETQVHVSSDDKKERKNKQSKDAKKPSDTTKKAKKGKKSKKASINEAESLQACEEINAADREIQKMVKSSGCAKSDSKFIASLSKASNSTSKASSKTEKSVPDNAKKLHSPPLVQAKNNVTSVRSKSSVRDVTTESKPMSFVDNNNVHVKLPAAPSADSTAEKRSKRARRRAASKNANKNDTLC